MYNINDEILILTHPDGNTNEVKIKLLILRNLPSGSLFFKLNSTKVLMIQTKKKMFCKIYLKDFLDFN